MAKSPEELAHQEWLGYVQPIGLVVSIPALVEAQCYVNKNIMSEHARFLSCLVREKPEEPLPEIRDLSEFTQKVLGWEDEDLIEIPQRVALTGDKASLEVVLPQYHETLRPTHGVPVFRPAEGENPWMVIIQELAAGTDFDDPAEADSAKHWNAAPQAKFERLLRETGVPIGLLSNRRQLRLVYAPKGESSGHATFDVGEMMQVAGRPMFAALQMLLCSDRMFSLADNQRLPAILENSRKYQNTVSTKLAEQVLAALYELMRGFQAADDVRKGELLREVLASDPNHVYSGLLTVLMRLVFVMYAEDRDLLSSDSVYSNYYSVTGLFNRLREDAGRFPDTMNQRYGAWSQLITLFRLVYEGGQHGDLKLPARKGYLFDPDRYPFLEGRQQDGDSPCPVPRVSDGVVYHVLRNLLILDGERLSYRTLDVEQIGSVYETVMGFNLEVAAGKSIAIKPIKSHGAPATINLEALLETKDKDRAKWLKEVSDQKITGAALKELKAAETIDELLTALDKKIQKNVTPRIVPAGAIVLQPSDERRRSGSHYTPRSLTEPIVRTTLEPILKQLCDEEADLPVVYEPTREDKKRYTKGEIANRIRLSERAIEYARQARKVGTPHPSQILDLKVCDPAMGSGAFLVETCRQLGDELIAAWYAHDAVPTDIPPDEDEILYARRLVAQRCLYGVDKNDMAVDLAKLSLWLVTLAKDHPFTFLDHALRHGDSLVGLTRRQIIGFHWEPKKQKQFGEDLIQKRLDRATEARAKILNAREDVPYRDQEQRMANAEAALSVVRLTGDACVSAFFAGSKKKEREDRCEELFASVSEWYASGRDPAKRGPIAAAVSSLSSCEHPIPPFHWEIEFPEVFSRVPAGFDAFIGNPPFLGGVKISGAIGSGFLDWLKVLYPNKAGNADLVAYFFRRAFSLLKEGGSFGLIATNSIAQGDTRRVGLSRIRETGGVIYSAQRRLRWPGVAAVIVSTVHVLKSSRFVSVPRLDGRNVERINAFMLTRGPDDDPAKLSQNADTVFRGAVIFGSGFILEPEEAESLMNERPGNSQCIFRYLTGEDINSQPASIASRFVINFGNRQLDECAAWPELLQIVEERVRPDREAKTHNAIALRQKEHWWLFRSDTPYLKRALVGLNSCLAISQVSNHISFSRQPVDQVFSHTTHVFAIEAFSDFAILQSRIHETWARFFGSSMKDDLRYNPTDCFEPFPLSGPSNILDAQGEAYFNFRSHVQEATGQGMTSLYNRFHSPHEQSSEILHLRELHAAMDRVVLETYGWGDLAKAATCEFLLDYEEVDDESSGKKPKKKKPWRLRWPDDFRDEVLARLLELNEERHKEELRTGSGRSVDTESKRKNTKRTKKGTNGPASGQQDLFGKETAE